MSAQLNVTNTGEAGWRNLAWATKEDAFLAQNGRLPERQFPWRMIWESKDCDSARRCSNSYKDSTARSEFFFTKNLAASLARTLISMLKMRNRNRGWRPKRPSSNCNMCRAYAGKSTLLSRAAYA